MKAFKLGSIGGTKRVQRLLWVTVAAAALGLGVGGVSLASQGAANNSNPLVVKLVSRATTINNFVDTGPAGTSPGDLYIWTDRELLASSPDDQFGTADGRCAVIDPATLKFDCSITTHIAEGSAGYVVAMRSPRRLAGPS